MRTRDTCARSPEGADSVVDARDSTPTSVRSLRRYCVMGNNPIASTEDSPDLVLRTAYGVAGGI